MPSWLPAVLVLCCALSAAEKQLAADDLTSGSIHMIAISQAIFAFNEARSAQGDISGSFWQLVGVQRGSVQAEARGSVKYQWILDLGPSTCELSEGLAVTAEEASKLCPLRNDGIKEAWAIEMQHVTGAAPKLLRARPEGHEDWSPETKAAAAEMRRRMDL